MELRIEPTIKQDNCYEAIDTPGIDEVFFGGGAGGGKSWAICESRLIKAVRFPGYKSFIGRNELKRLMQSTFITWHKVCAHHKIPQDTWRLDGKYNVIEFDNGSKIDLLDVKFNPSDPLYERFGSLEYTDGAIEEAGETHPLAREVLKTRVNRHLNDKYGINPCLLSTGNPKKNWTYHTFYKPWKDGSLPKNMVFIQSLYKDNPHAQSTYDKTLSGIKDNVMRQRLKDGNWEYEDDPSVLMKYEAISDLFTNHLPHEDEYGIEIPQEKYATVDVARFGGDKIVLTCWKGWEAYKIVYREKQSLETTKLWLKDELKIEGIPYSHTMADEDGVGGGLVDMMSGIRGFIANSSPVEVSVDETYSLNYDEREEKSREPKTIYANLKTQCAYILAEKVNSRLCSVKTDDVQIRTWLTEDLELIREANTDSDDKKKHLLPKNEVIQILGRSPDFGDTMIMRAAFELKEPKKSHVITQNRPDWISRKPNMPLNDPMGVAQTRPKWISPRHRR